MHMILLYHMSGLSVGDVARVLRSRCTRSTAHDVPVVQRHKQSRDTESAHGAHEMSTLSSHVETVTHKSPRVLYNHR